MKWPVLILTLCTLAFCFTIASETASAQTYGSYGAGFYPSPYNGYPQPYYGYNPGFTVGSYGGFNGYGMGSQVAFWRYQPNGWSSQIAFSFNRPAGYGRHRHHRHCNCR